jgi:tagatose-1,6-bisphosphate aldolase non-catalytic subunit AgaZ/GatZ
VLVEATSNQVDQFGGYTGMRPPDFRALVLGAARDAGLPAERVLLGGDHLRPNPWRDRPAAEAMALAEELVASYMTAGFTKLHLDCSMPCADDPPALGDGPVSERAARLARAAEAAALDPDAADAADAGAGSTLPPRPLSYVIGTDYETPERLAALVRNHWAILKVGPALTFALREALFALEPIERELCPEAERSRLRAVLEARMLAHPEHWARYYAGGEAAQRIARAYSYSDRLRYCWPDPDVEAAVQRLLANLDAVEIPLPVLSARLPPEYARVRAGRLAPQPRALVLEPLLVVVLHGP